MKLTKQTVKKMLLPVMQKHLDSSLKEYGFTRNKSSIEYKLSTSEAKQKIIVENRIPSYSDSKYLFAIEPYFNVTMPAITNELLKIARGQKELLPPIEPTIGMNIAFIAEEGQNRIYKEWRIQNQEELDKAGEELRNYIVSLVLPPLGKLKTVEELASSYEELTKKRLWSKDKEVLTFTAAYLVLGDY